MTIYDQQLDKNAANFVALSPVSFVERTAEVFGDLPAVVRRADIVVAAVGRAEMVKADWIKPGAAVLDVGITRVDGADGKSSLVGDVHPDVANVAGYLSPNPGGVGPMTRAMLAYNVVEAASR